MSEREDREAFEAVCDAEFMDISRFKCGSSRSGEYVSPFTEQAWWAWQAALRYERERARESGNAE